MNELSNIVGDTGYGEVTKQCESPSLYNTLKRKQKELTARLDDVNKAVEALENNPEVAKLLELVARAR